MAITFENIPGNQRVPGTYLEISPRNPLPEGSVGRMLLVGVPASTITITNDGQGENNAPRLVQVSSVSEAERLYGVGSQLASMISAALANTTNASIWAYAINPASGATAWNQELTITFEGGGSSTTGGTVTTIINGIRVVSQVSGDVTAVAGQIVSDVNANTSLPVTATNVAGVITFTSKFVGVLGNFTQITGDNGTTDVAFSFATPSVGTNDITFDPTVLGDAQFDTIVLPEATTALLDTVKTLVESRWEATGAQRRIYGHVWAARRGTVTTHETFLTARNDEHATVLCYEDGNPTPEYIMAAAYAARGHQSLVSDAALPLTGLNLRGVFPPALVSSPFNGRDRNTLLNAGGATVRYESGEVLIERAVNTASGTNLPVWRDVQTPYTLMVCLRTFANFADTNYARVKLVGDGEQVAVGSRTVSPNSIRLDTLGVYDLLIERGLCENAAQFEMDLVVERATDDVTRVNMTLPLNLVNQLRVLAVQVNFTL